MQLDLAKLESDFGIRPGPVIHAGASYCQEREIYQQSRFLPVFWIEALNDVVIDSKDLLRDYPQQQIFNVTLWSLNDVEVEFNRTSNDGESSSILKLDLHQYIHPNVNQTFSDIHITTTLDTFSQNNNLPNEISLLVLDLQGAELQALQGAAELLKSTKAVFVEVSTVQMYKGQAIFAEVHAFLSSLNFGLVEHDLFENAVMGDALYINREPISMIDLVFLDPPARQFDFKFSFYLLRAKLLKLGIPKYFLRNPFN